MAASKLRLYRDALRLLADARLAIITDDTESRFALDDAWDECVAFCLRQAAWRFALARAALVVSGVVAPGYTSGFAYPENWTRTHKIFALGPLGRECPVDLRETPAGISANVAALHMDFVSNAYGNPDIAVWPETFAQLVAAYLAFLIAERVTGERGAAGRMSQLFSELLGEARRIDAEPDDRWLPHQRNGAFERAKNVVLLEGFWVWRDPAGIMRGLKEVAYDSTAQIATQPAYALPYRYALPADWLRTHALFIPWDGEDCPINARESAQDWSTDAQSFVARYVSTEVLDSTAWPQAIEDAVLAYAEWKAAPADKATAYGQAYLAQLAAARAAYAQPKNEWLRFELDGSYQAAVKKELESGRWRFAIRSPVLTPTSDPLPAELSDGAPVLGYLYRFIQPNDLLRTVRVFYQRGTVISGAWDDERCDIDFVDEAGAYHANYSPITVRYVSRMGLNSTTWTAHFRDAVLAWLQYQEARNDPAQASLAAAKLALYRDACAKARDLDDARDRPRIIRPGYFVRARMGQRGRYPERSTILVTPPSTSSDVLLTNEDGGILTDEAGSDLTK